jgi:hypothetical protein
VTSGALSDHAARGLRIRAQRLHPSTREGAAPVDDILRDVVALQAQVPEAAALGVRARSTGLTAADVERARVDSQKVVRTWCLRGTLHLLAAEDVPWLLRLLAQPVLAGNRKRYEELGLDDITVSRALEVIGDAIAEGEPLTRAELAEHLARSGIDPAGQRIAHLVGRAALEGLLCLGPHRGGKATYMPLPPTASRRIERDDALAQLARRYIRAYGPAGPLDLAAWSGLSVPDARLAWSSLEGEAVEVSVAGEPAWIPAERVDWVEERDLRIPIVALLPSFDAYLLGYRTRDLSVPSAHGRKIWPGGGWLHPTVISDGRAVATWKTERRRDRLALSVAPFASLSRQIRRAIKEEAADIGRFLETETSLSVLD